MNILTLNSATREKYAEWLASDDWLIACLCAGWCDVCGAYAATFARLADGHAALRFVWIDIEDNAELVDHMDVENFPTLLMQRGDCVSFFGPLTPDARIVEAVLAAQLRKSMTELALESQSTPQRRKWQSENNLRRT